MRIHDIARAAVVLALVAASVHPAPLAAQADTAVAVAGERYRLPRVLRPLLGGGNRLLWTTPFRGEVLDPARLPGGLARVERVVDWYGVALRLHAADGGWIDFHPLDRDVDLATDPALAGTLAGRLVQDRVSRLHPVGPVVAAPLWRAAGVPAPQPRLVVMPDLPALGEHRAEFAGTAGLLEEHLGGEEGDVEVIGTDELLRRLQADPGERADARAYLVVRLMDVYLGEWTRGEDLWRWVRAGGSGPWSPVAALRERSFVRSDGLLRRLEKRVFPGEVAFGDDYGELVGLVSTAQRLDQRLLAGLPRTAWDSAALGLRARLTDAVIEEAVARMPPEYPRREREALAARLRARRDRLGEAAGRFYDLLAGDVEVHGTDRAELARVDRTADGRVRVRLYPVAAGRPAAAPRYERSFLPAETREIRIFLHGGEDRAVVAGDARRGPRLRLLGGEGDDLLADSSLASPVQPKTVIHDVAAGDSLLVAPSTRVGFAALAGAAPDDPGDGLAPPREWGARRVLRPWADYHSAIGVVVGASGEYVRYGFRQHPFAFRLDLRASYAMKEQDFGLDLRGEFHRESSDAALLVRAHASRIAWMRFHGFGNDTRVDPDAEVSYDVVQDDYLVESLFHLPVPGRGTLSVGPVVRYTRPHPEPGSRFASERPFGSAGFGMAGAVAGLRLDRRSPTLPAERGLVLETRGAFYPAAWGLPRSFGKVGGRATAYFPLALPLRPTLAVGAGAERVWGGYPVQEAAFLGGAASLRGYHAYRFAGDAAVHGTLGARATLARVDRLLRGDLGAFLIADAGRVFLDGRSPGGWHADAGGGLLYLARFRERDPFAVSLTVVRGERSRVFLQAGMPF